MDETIVKAYSNEWIYASFRLQLLLGHPNIKIVSLKKREFKFASTYDSFLKIEAAVDITDVDMPTITSIKNSLKKDVVLKAGRLSQVRNGNKKDERNYRVLLMKMALLQILPTLKEPSLSSEDLLLHHPNYDSIYLSPRQSEMTVFSHEYLTRQPRQYQWQYDVEYTYTDFTEWSALDVKCESCKTNAAQYYCSEDKEAYCWPCFGDLHRSSKKSKHQKEPLNPFNCPPRCQKSLHENQPLTHYCQTCKHLKCENCLADGHHRWNNQQISSNGEPLHDIFQSRQLAGLLRQKQKEINSELKLKITGLIREIENKIQMISGHYDMRVKEFIHWFEQKTANARQTTVEELNLATGLHSQLKRRYDEVLWLQNFSRQMQQRCNAQSGMQIKQGITIYVTRAFTQEYFQRLQKKIQEIKIFN